ncbi:MAG: tetratricopeptide repeat protein [Sedimentisphaerales bacterium]|nr:tetratricopeptide repeat protein [Sedimentisphaerales bacterium]
MQNTEHGMQNAERRTLFVCFALAIAVLAAYEGVRKNNFVNYDDNIYITDNPRVQKGLNADSLKWALTDSETGYWHPLTWLSHITDCAVFGMKPAGHHMVSVGFHIANVLLLFLILKKTTGAFWPSVFVSAVFGLHPLGVESVAWVAERKNVLSSFFAFLTILAYLRYTQKPCVGRYLAVAFLFAAGLLSKPMLVTLPFGLMLLDFWPICRFSNARGWRWLWASVIDKTPLLVMSAALSAATIIHTKKESMSGLDLVPMGARMGNTVAGYIGYIGKIFYPVNLSVLYPINLDGPPLGQAVVCFLALALISSGAFLLRRKRGYLFTGWFWYLGTLVPVIGLVQVGSQSMADRYIYIPGIGIYIIVAWLTADATAGLRLRREIIASIGVCILAVLLIVTRKQAGYWKDGITLCRRATAVTKDNYIMHTNLGCALQDRGSIDEAEAEFEKALQIMPNHAEANNGYGVILAQKGLYDEAIARFRKALSGKTFIPGALNNLCKAGVEGGKLNAALEIIKGLEQKTPDNAELYYNEGMIYRMLGNDEQCIALLEKALELAKSRNKLELVAEIQPRLERYRQTKKQTDDK